MRTATMALSHVVVLVLCAISASLANSDDCKQGVNCFLPDCFCPTFTHPMGSRNIPQIVYFGFDDAVTPQVSTFFRQLFTEDRVNPNGCPITMSLFVCHRYTIYSLVSEFFSEYDEIGVHSVTHTFINTEDKLRAEATQQRQNIEFGANVPGGDIIGWRSPDLITAGDGQPRVLKELNYTYDISLPFEVPGKYAFPYTLDYGYPYGCSVVPCPGKDSKHAGFWEVPINAHWDPVSGIPCCYVDGCRPNSEEEAYNFLMTNFLNSYNGERAPFGLNMHAAWFYWPMYFSAMERFVQTILDSYPETYIVSVSQMMAWMKNPQNIQQSKTFSGWDCPWSKAKRAQKAKALVVEPPKPVPTPDMSDYVDSRLHLSILQDYYLRHQLPKPYLNKDHENKERTDLSQYVDSRLSLNDLQNFYLRHKLPKPYLNAEHIQQERPDLSQYVDPRLSLNDLQNYYLKHKLPKPYTNQELKQEHTEPTEEPKEIKQEDDFSKYVDPRLSLSTQQKAFIKLSLNKAEEKPEKESPVQASLLFKSMKTRPYY